MMAEKEMPKFYPVPKGGPLFTSERNRILLWRQYRKYSGAVFVQGKVSAIPFKTGTTRASQPLHRQPIRTAEPVDQYRP
jgi:hypothetical protein